MLRKAPAALLLMAVFLPACGTAKPEEPRLVEVDTAFQLPLGASAQLRGSHLRLGFDAVLSDSRCPKGEQCVWAGEAVVRIWLQRASAGRQSLDLRLPPHAEPGSPSQALRLIRLEPAPVAGKTFAQADYVATLLIPAESLSAMEVAADK
ncbi:hypothetical protein HNP55_000971 [Paucibacter oligotrophus]|uniref:Uncharacterized protein n=1 Tax=Roseateles oligotrophus TaxID=1769250 RepID=A0A840L3D3_9BURK|nr:hypothetical protein [Roseateles oligotrophus]MBB4842456.1 hypothetical protein [Roseateles oligotrophus]